MASIENNESIRSLIKEFLDVFDVDNLERSIRTRWDDPLSDGSSIDKRIMRGERENYRKIFKIFTMVFSLQNGRC